MYSIIVARNSTNGIGISTDSYHQIPWPIDRDDMNHFKTLTINQIVIMGRKTWESLPNKPLKDRTNIVLTNGPSLDGALTFKSIKDCDKYLNNQGNLANKQRWVIGGESIYNQYLEHDLVSNIYVSQIDSNEECNRYFNWEPSDDWQFKYSWHINRSLKVYHYTKILNHEELHLQHTMDEIIHNGFVQSNRTGTNTRAIFGKMFEYIMSEKIDPQTGESMFKLPLLTTKKMFARGVFEELKWFLNGRVDSKELEQKGINIWKGNTSREFLDKANLSEYDEGETGPIYGFQWRHWGAKYVQGKRNYASEGVDQVEKVIQSLQSDPFSRRHIISGWNVEDLDQMCLPPCFPKDTLVLTKSGYKAIQHILDNDLVLSHQGNWKSIINRQERMFKDTMYKILHVGNSNPIIATKEHPFLVKTIHMTGLEPLTYKLSKETSWVAAQDLENHKHVLCIPIIQEQTPVNITIAVDREFKNIGNIDYFMIGYYVGKQGKFLEIEFIPPGWSILQEFNNDQTQCNIIPEWVQSLPKDNLRDFVKGFECTSRMSANYYNVINQQVALSLQRIYAKIGILVAVKSNDQYTAIYHYTNDMNGRISMDDKYLYIPIQQIESFASEQTVFNLEVADDNSYVVENIAVHNCHVLYQFMVHEEREQKYLSLMMTQRSCDTFLGLPFNVCSLGMFLFLMANTVGMKPYKIIHSIADMHIYDNHILAVKQQLVRAPYAFPYIKLKAKKERIEDYEYSDIEIVNYFSHSTIKADMIA